MGDDKKDSHRDSKEWKKRRYEKAFDLAKRIKYSEMERRKDDGNEPAPDGTFSIGELANYLLKKERDRIDKLVEDDLRRLEETASKTKSGIKTPSISKKKLESISEGFKDYMDKKRDSEKSSDIRKSEKKSTKFTSESTFKRVMSDAKQIRKSQESAEDKKIDGKIKDIENLTKRLDKEIVRSKKRLQFHDVELIQEKKSDFETEIKKQLGFAKMDESFKIGVIDNRVYFWKPNETRNDMLNAWSKQYFYFKETKELSNIITDSLRMIGLNPNESESKSHLNKLIDHLLEPTENDTLRKSRHLNEKRMHGESLKLLLDILGEDTSYLEGKISKITGIKGQGGLENPKFPSGSELEELRARIIGTVVSDGQVRGSKGLIYFETSDERIDRFEKTLQNFGDIKLKRVFRKERGTYEIYICSAISEAVSFWRIPEGDRTILNYGLPSDTKNWTKTAQRALIQDMLSQEGCVSENGEISWNRRHALCAGSKSESYHFKSKISQEAIDFLKNSTKVNRNFETGNAGEIYLSMGQLESLKTDKDPVKSKIAREISDVVYTYRNRLIEDEVSIVRNLGIDISLRPVQVSYYKKSGRVSVRWEARIRDTDSIIRSALLLRPNDDIKGSILNNWLFRQHPKKVRGIMRQLDLEGFEITS